MGNAQTLATQAHAASAVLKRTISTKSAMPECGTKCELAPEFPGAARGLSNERVRRLVMTGFCCQNPEGREARDARLELAGWLMNANGDGHAILEGYAVVIEHAGPATAKRGAYALLRFLAESTEMLPPNIVGAAERRVRKLDCRNPVQHTLSRLLHDLLAHGSERNGARIAGRAEAIYEEISHIEPEHHL